MKKALIIAGAAVVLGTSRREVTVLPCSKTMKVTYYQQGKVVYVKHNKASSYISNLSQGINNTVDGKIYHADSITFDIVPDKIRVK